MAEGHTPTMWKKATASGRGPGKSALVSWLGHCMMTTCLGSTTIVTANTEPQLKTRTFAEIGKWLNLAINKHWFDASVLKIEPSKWFGELLSAPREKGGLNIDTRYYYTQGQLWSEESPDAFAGAHNPLGMQVLMDEASGIPNSIFNVTQGFFTEPELHRFWHVFSNARRNSGAFYDCFHKPGSTWRTRHIDSRTVEGIDKALFDSMIEEHGVDSYTVRVEVLGQFPRAGDHQFIGNDAVHAAQQRDVMPDTGAPLIMGMDVARYGDDWNVVRFRQGNNGRLPTFRWQGIDNYASADRAAALIDEHKPDAICIDGGQGSGVIDILRRKKYRVTEVMFGGGASVHQWANKGTELYAKIREWLPSGMLDKHPRLFTDLTGRDYEMSGKGKDQIKLMEKEKYKQTYGHSPDDGDAFALTFATTTARRDSPSRLNRSRIAQGVDANQFGE
jgi:hypothetical protein